MALVEDAYAIPFFDHDHSFCESLLWGDEHSPEWFNTISSLALCITTIQLHKKINDAILNLLLVSLFLNGLFSAAYHWSHAIGWGVLDRLMMSFIALFSFIRLPSYPIPNVTVIMAIFTTLSLHWETWFNILFGTYMATMVLKLYRLDDVIINRGICIIVASAIFWLFSDGLCLYHPLIRYIPGHAMWHIGLAVGLYQILPRLLYF